MALLVATGLLLRCVPHFLQAIKSDSLKYVVRPPHRRLQISRTPLSTPCVPGFGRGGSVGRISRRSKSRGAERDGLVGRCQNRLKSADNRPKRATNPPPLGEKRVGRSGVFQPKKGVKGTHFFFHARRSATGRRQGRSSTLRTDLFQVAGLAVYCSRVAFQTWPPTFSDSIRFPAARVRGRPLQHSTIRYHTRACTHRQNNTCREKLPRAVLFAGYFCHSHILFFSIRRGVADARASFLEATLGASVVYSAHSCTIGLYPTYAHWLGLSTAEIEDVFNLPCSRRLGLQVAAQAGGWLAQGQARPRGSGTGPALTG
eukprot:scaffold8926_cov69-Phaeocystis_antarctica.AAC.3